MATRARKFLDWLFYTVAFPIFIIGMAFAIQHWVIEKPHAFEEIFGTGDLIPLAALLLLSMYAEIKAAAEGRLGLDMYFSEYIFIGLSILALICYGVIKTDAFGALRSEAYEKLALYAKLSCALMFYTIIHTASVKFRLEGRRGHWS